MVGAYAVFSVLHVLGSFKCNRSNKNEILKVREDFNECGKMHVETISKLKSRLSKVEGVGCCEVNGEQNTPDINLADK